MQMDYNHTRSSSYIHIMVYNSTMIKLFVGKDDANIPSELHGMQHTMLSCKPH